MAPEAAHPSLRSNFREDWRETYLQYTEYFIREGFGLRALYRSSADSASTYKQSGELPSWVPDFSFEGKLTWFANDHNQVHGDTTTAGGLETPSLKINMHSRILTVRAMKVDTIRSLSPNHARQQIDSHYAHILQWRTELEELWPATQSSSEEEKQNTICRVMHCRQELSDLEKVWPLIWASDATEFDSGSAGKALFLKLINPCMPRRRCITSTGFPALQSLAPTSRAALR
jgi:hypothetical protein